MNKTISGKIFGFASGLVVFAMLFSPSASVVRYVFAEEVLPPVVEEVVTEENPSVVEEPTVEDSFVCDVDTNPILTSVKGFYLEYTYGVDAQLLSILSDIQISASDPNDNLMYFYGEPVTDLFSGGTSSLNVGVYKLPYIAVDFTGCTDQKEMTIVVNPSPDLICDETNSPVITTPEDLYHYPTETGYYPYLAISSDIHTVTYHDPSDLDVDLNYTNNIDKIFSGLNTPVGVYHIVHGVVDPIGCSDEKNVTVVVGPMCQAVAPTMTVEDSSVTVQRNASLEDILNKAGFSMTDATSDLFTPHFTTDFNSDSINQAGTFVLTITAVEDNELCIPSSLEIEVTVSGGGNGGGGNSSGSGSSGTVLGATTGEVLGATTCAPYLETYMRKGIVNNVEEVKKLQTFLNQEMNAGLPVTGVFKSLTDQAVKNFQNKYKADILTPWGATMPTGLVYKTTQTKINNIMCAELNLPIPTDLIPFSQYLKTK